MTKTLAPPRILTLAGTYFDFNAPEKFDFDINVIAHSLSNICRFTGQVREFYSVAQHSVIVSHLVAPEFALVALMHDMAESVLGDVSSPLKSMLSEYRAIENRVEAAMAAYFGLPFPFPSEVKDADMVALATEKRDLMHAPEILEVWNMIENVHPSPLKIIPMPPAEARALFLGRWDELGGLHHGALNG